MTSMMLSQNTMEMLELDFGARSLSSSYSSLNNDLNDILAPRTWIKIDIRRGWCTKVGQEWRHGSKVDAPDKRLQNAPLVLCTNTHWTRAKNSAQRFCGRDYRIKRVHAEGRKGDREIQAERERKKWERIEWFVRMIISLRPSFIELNQNRKVVRSTYGSINIAWTENVEVCETHS